MSDTEGIILAVLSVVTMAYAAVAIMKDAEDGTMWHNATFGARLAKVLRVLLLLAGLSTIIITIIILDAQSITKADKSLVETLQKDYGITLELSEAERFRNNAELNEPEVDSGFYTLGTVRQDEMNYAILTNGEGEVKVYLIFSDKMQRVPANSN
jgi:hypothetical protein